jgi:hypothetical protein
MIADARQQLGMPDGKTSALTLKSGPDGVRWHAGVMSDRQVGAVEYDLKGRKIKVMAKR